MKLHFYQNIASPHQVATLRALAERCGCSVTLYVERVEDPWRREMGWTPPDFGNIPVVRLRDRADAARMVRSAEPDAIHISSGWDAYPLVYAALREAIRLGRRWGVLAESGEGYGLRGRLRALKSRLLGIRFRRDLDFLLAAGQLGVNWYCRAGFDASRTFPFGYFVDAPAGASTAQPQAQDAVVKLIYVGALAERKGSDILLRAVSGTRASSWRLDIIGDGPMRRQCEAIVDRYQLAGRVRFLGVLPRHQALTAMADADALILPSRWDGWGAVVNEALMQGVPVICSSRCGAADLVRSVEHGLVFEAGSVAGLARALERIVGKGKVSTQARARLKEWAKRIEPSAAAEYFVKILQATYGAGTRPIPPWEAESSASMSEGTQRWP